MSLTKDKDVATTFRVGNEPGVIRTLALAPAQLRASGFSQSIYGDPAAELDGLLESIRDHGILVPLVVTHTPDDESWHVVSGNRRLTCATALGLEKVPCEVAPFQAIHHTNWRSWNITVSAKRISAR